MDLMPVLSRLTAASGVTGNEFAAGEAVADYFRQYTGDVWRDSLGNVFGRIGEGKPTLLVMAHMDEVGMVVTKIEENGMLRLKSVAGLDPRVLPGSEVLVYGTEPVPAVVGAIPPHLLGDERSEAYKMDDLVCDTGLTPAHVAEKIAVGDYATFKPEPPLPLLNNRVSGKTLDDRALVAVMIEAMERLSRCKLGCTVVFCASCQEEKNGHGAIAGANGIQPDLAVAMDVTHPLDKTELEKLELTMGGNIHPKIYAKLAALADELRIPYETEACIGQTGTDTCDIQVQCGGIPAGLFSVPLNYMHTSVELGSLNMLHQASELIAAFAAWLTDQWEDTICWDD